MREKKQLLFFSVLFVQLGPIMPGAKRRCTRTCMLQTTRSRAMYREEEEVEKREDRIGRRQPVSFFGASCFVSVRAQDPGCKPTEQTNDNPKKGQENKKTDRKKTFNP